MYEYVKRNEYQSIRLELERIIPKTIRTCYQNLDNKSTAVSTIILQVRPHRVLELLSADEQRTF